MMQDLISKQAAIDALEREKSLVERPITETRWFDLGLGKAQDVLNELPSAQPEPKMGKWIPVVNGRGGHECNQCHEYAPSYQAGEEHLSDFCPNCGAKMRQKNRVGK